MTRIFNSLSILTALMFLMMGGGAYWFVQSNGNQADFQATEARAKGAMLSLSSQINTLQSTLDKMALSAEAIAAIESGDELKRVKTAEMMQQLIPNIISFQILPIHIEKLSQSSLSNLGNADLVMIRESITLKKNQYPTVQGIGEHRHLALTSIVHKNDHVIGVIFASLHFNFLQATLNEFQAPNSVIELRQSSTTLAMIGDSSNKNETNRLINMTGTSWNIHYWHLGVVNLTTLLYFSGITLLAILLICLACFSSQQQLQAFLKQDYKNITLVIKDLVTEKNVGSYPMYFNEMENVATQIVQLKRDLTRENTVQESPHVAVELTEEDDNNSVDMSAFGFDS